MRKKIIGILVCILLIAVTIPTFGTIKANNTLIDGFPDNRNSVFRYTNLVNKDINDNQVGVELNTLKTLTSEINTGNNPFAKNVFNNVYKPRSYNRNDVIRWPPFVDVVSGGAYSHSYWSRFDIESNGMVHMVWCDDPGGDGFIDNIYYRNKPRGGTWSLTEIAPTNSNIFHNPDITVDQYGTAHVAWGEAITWPEFTLYYRNRSNTGIWSDVEMVSGEFDGSIGPSLYVELDGTIHVLWVRFDGLFESGELCYKCKPSGGEWPQDYDSLSILNSIISPPFLDISYYEGDKTIHVIWCDTDEQGEDSDIYYMSKQNEDDWPLNPELVSTDSTGSAFSPTFDVLQVGSYANVHVAWFDNTDYFGSGQEDFDIFYKCKQNGEDWSTVDTQEVTPESTMQSVGPSLKVEDDGTTHITWTEEYNMNRGDIKYKYKPRNGDWADSYTYTVSTESEELAKFPYINLDSDGAVHIVWEDKTDYREFWWSGKNDDNDIFYKKCSYENEGTTFNFPWGAYVIFSYGKGWSYPFGPEAWHMFKLGRLIITSLVPFHVVLDIDSSDFTWTHFTYGEYFIGRRDLGWGDDPIILPANANVFLSGVSLGEIKGTSYP